MSKLVHELGDMGTVLSDEPLSRHVTFGVGGPADLYFKARNRDALLGSFLAAGRLDVPCLVLGAGSNVLVGDGGVRGLVIENEATTVSGPEPAEDDSAGIVEVESGVSFAALARRMCREGWGGVEWAVGIPGSLGGAVVHNAGAYDGCLADVLVDAEICDPKGVSQVVAGRKLDFAYRKSVFVDGELSGSLVVAVRLLLHRRPPAELLGQVAAYDRERTQAQPPGRNCGSVFKNPPGQTAWQLVSAVGLRGKRIGQAQISEKHANFILNLGEARAADVRALIEAAQSKVREHFGLELETEVNLVGEWS